MIGALLLRLWSLGAELGLVAGVYLMLAGVARFVEESYRGEPQTPVVAGLRLYQWMAVLSLAVGMVLTAVPSGSATGLRLPAEPRVFVAALLFGLLTGAAMGVDVPGSARRFARLAPP